MKIYCCNCKAEIAARLTSGEEIYPHRKDLHSLPFWVCDDCRGYVGCHHKTVDRVRPLGCIASPEIKKARIYLHALIDTIWKKGNHKRGSVYKKISDAIGYRLHTAEIKTIEEARRIYRTVKEMEW